MGEYSDLLGVHGAVRERGRHHLVERCAQTRFAREVVEGASDVQTEGAYPGAA